MQNDKSSLATPERDSSAGSAAGLHRLARRAEKVVWFAVGILVVAPAVGWAAPGITEERILRLLRVPFEPPVLTPQEAWVGWAATMIPIAVLAFGLAQIAVFLRHVQRDETFSPHAVRCIQRLGWALIVAAVLFPCARYGVIGFFGRQPFRGLLGGMLAPGAVIVSLSTLGVGVLAFARVFTRAVSLARENAEFV